MYLTVPGLTLQVNAVLLSWQRLFLTAQALEVRELAVSYPADSNLGFHSQRVTLNGQPA